MAEITQPVLKIFVDVLKDGVQINGLSSVSTDATLSGNGSSGAPLKIAQQGATSGQVLTWNGTSWVPDDSAGSDGGGFQFNINDRAAATAGGTNAVFVPLNTGSVDPRTSGNFSNTFNSTQGATEMAFDGTLRDAIASTNAPFSGSGGVFTIYKNGVATSFVTTLPDNAGSVENTSDGLSFVRGDFLSLKVTSSNLNDYAFTVRVIPVGSAPSGSVNSVTAGPGASVDNTDPANPIVSSAVQSRQVLPFFFGQPDGPDTYYGLVSASAGNSDATNFDAYTPMPWAGTLTQFRLKGDSVGLTANEIMFVAVDGVNTTITATITNAGQEPTDLVHTHHFDAGAKVSIHYDPESEGNISGFSGSIGVIWD